MYMKLIIWCPLLLLIFLLPQVLGADWEDYKPNIIARLIIDYSEYYKDKGFFYTPGIPFTTTVTYLGNTRKILPERSTFIEMWLKTYSMNPDLAKTFNQEILIDEDGNKYWLPIQHVLIPYLNKEVMASDKVILYVRFAGAINNDCVFLVNEFSTLQTKRATNKITLTSRSATYASHN
jgi:hypothetical protein